MPSKDVRRHARPAAPSAASEVDWLRRLASGRAVWILFACAVLLFYAAPLFQPDATIQWDAADYHLSVQRYFAAHLLAGQLPHWTPYPYLGMPFLADPQVGAWYPLNWPFFLFGITPRAIEWELALHCFLALAGAFLLAREITRDTVAALFGGAFYAFSGFFAAHSSHVGMFQSAALLPWLVYAGIAALRWWRWLPVCGAIAAILILAGHFQSALYALTAFALFLAGYAFAARIAWWRAAAVVLATAVLALGLTAIQTLPGLELTGQSLRAGADYQHDASGALVPGALLTLLNPDRYQAPSVEAYTGPGDVTQFYFYQGLLLLPLAALGAARGGLRLPVLAPGIAALWYAFGPAAGFFRFAALLPGFRSVRAPVHAWFVVALALALLAASGAAWLSRRYPQRWLPLLMLAVSAADLWYWNMDTNRLAYGRQSFDERYGSLSARFQSVAAATRATPLPRLWAPLDSPAFGPLNAMLDQGYEVTYGYNPLALSRYTRYLDAASANPRLLDALAVTAKLGRTSGRFDPNPAALPRLYAPTSVVTVGSRDEAAARLAALNPPSTAIVETAAVPAGTVEAVIRGYTESEYTIDYQAPGAALLRIAVPYFPGWRAVVDGHALPVLAVDLALSGVVVPAGSHRLIFQFRSTWFEMGMLVSILFCIGTAVWIILVWRRPQREARRM